MSLEAIQDFPEYEYVDDYHHDEDGIDKGRDGEVILWSDTEWQGSRDFQQDMTVTVDTFEADGRTFTVTARPDRRDRGSGASFSISVDSGSLPIDLDRSMYSMEDVQDAIDSYMSGLEGEQDNVIEELGHGWVLVEDADTGEYAGVGNDNGTEIYLDDGGDTTETERLFVSKERVREAFRAWERQQKGMVKVEELGLGWVIFETADLEYIVAAGEGTYLDGDGKIVSDEYHFDTKDRARDAFKTWRDDRHDSISEARSEMNEVMRQRAEEVDEVLEESRGGGGEVITESEVVEGDSQVIEGDSQVIEGETTTETVAGGAADMFDSATDTATDAAETARSSVGEFEPRQIPIPVLGAVLLIVAWRFLR